jgi:uncharacterized protein YjaZ
MVNKLKLLVFFCICTLLYACNGIGTSGERLLVVKKVKEGVNPGVYAQYANKTVLSDIPNFWKAYDSLVYIKDTIAQKQIIQHIYLDHASAGLIDFMNYRKLTASKWIKAINTYPKFWETIRPKTLAVYEDTANINRLMARFKSLYPEFKAPDVFFFIGNIKTGGTTNNSHVLMGAEIATADSSVNTEGLSVFIKNVFKQNSGVFGLVSHELVHTQQIFNEDDRAPQMNLLGSCLHEGVCDFIAELLTGQERQTPYIDYGKLNEERLWKKFKSAMYGFNTDEWLYNGGTANAGKADLGYFMGYAIGKYYYAHSSDKSAAVRDMLTINYNDSHSIQSFFDRTGYSKKYR